MPSLPQVQPGQTYGVAAAQQEALRAVPMARAQPGPTVVNVPTVVRPGGPAAAPPAPRTLTPLDAPSARPDEPVTAGVPMGAGPGPEVLGLAPPANPDNLDRDALARHLPALELLASQPNASQATRNFVRRLRGATPPGGF